MNIVLDGNVCHITRLYDVIIIYFFKNVKKINQNQYYAYVAVTLITKLNNIYYAYGRKN